MTNSEKELLIARFIRYVKTDTQSNENSLAQPSTNSQLEFANQLADELRVIGLSEVSVSEYSYVTATIPSTCNEPIPTIGFIAHLDTSPDLPGKNVKPQIIRYTGGDIVLNNEKNIILNACEFPDIKKYTGQEIIFGDGTTLLGADDKAGLAAIVSAANHLINNPQIRHGKIRLCFTPDEEIGRGTNNFDVESFGARYAYTIDGGELGELEYENFNAATARIDITGTNVHPGQAKNKMINALHLATEFLQILPPQQRPEHTEKHEGFFHLNNLTGTVEKTSFQLIIRDHDETLFEEKKHYLQQITRLLNTKYKNPRISCEIKDSYYNMKKKIEFVPFMIEYAEKAMVQLNIIPIKKPIRGGTDGSRLSFMGLPCPNIFGGGHYFHSKYEFLPVESLIKAAEVIVRISELYASEYPKLNIQ